MSLSAISSMPEDLINFTCRASRSQAKSPMPTKTELIFPSYIARGRLKQARTLNRDLSREIKALEKIDDFGRRWSSKNYTGGYSSYSSMDQLHRTSPNFAQLEKLLQPHVKAMVRKLHWNLLGGELCMTTCWANAMGNGTYHTMHLHPGSVLSGVYYVALPGHSSQLKIEDPRLGLMMAAPPRLETAPPAERNYLSLKSKPGEFILFESWMRHEVPPHRGNARRLSVSFNYEWT